MIASKNILLLFTTICFTFSVNAQFGIPKKRKAEAELIKTLPLLVVLHDYNEPFYKKMKVDLKEAIEKYWHYSKEVTFVSKDELREYEKDKSKRDKYAYLMFSERLYQANVPAGCFCIGLLNKKMFTHFKKFGNGNKELTMADYQQGLYWLQEDLEIVFNYKARKEDAGKLVGEFNRGIRKGMLLIDEDLVTEELKDDIGKLYKYDYEIVSKPEIDKAILDKKPNVFYLKPYYSIQRPIIKTSYKDPSTGRFSVVPTSSIVKTTKVNAITMNTIFSAQSNQFYMMFPTNKKAKTTSKQFKKGIARVLE
ncbi:hypothetical protein [Hyunsoonleella ulvae]|uniref:hypothetical protein n=1 Tax=Hyunsoonleella ulvae TaxID=2799948 RepID=UPI00193A7C68|nr:hypothetical protein [Hyunsoonleella ulvae]